MSGKIILKSVVFGILASGILLGVYFAILSFISGWDFAKSQFSAFWYFIVSLSLGFGIQIGLFSYLKSIIARAGAASAGVVSLIGQYQVELFFVGLAFNIAGIIYIGQKIIKFKLWNYF